MKSIKLESCSCFNSSSEKQTFKPSRSRRRNRPIITLVLMIGSVALFILTGGCTHLYQPKEYVIDEDRIAGFPIGTPVRIIGEPCPSDDQVVWDALYHTFVTNYNDVTTALVAQITKEMIKRGQPVSDSASKTIRLRVLKLGAMFAGSLTIEGSMLLHLQLGAAQPKVILINNTTPNFVSYSVDGDRALDGTIARAVIKILSDPSIRAFLGDMPQINPG